ncbi:hypothetical protein BGZ58_002996 [Dissophora ornata]|nr:hypothetical protein BGZ58_002996 [Dissophora ornata]
MAEQETITVSEYIAEQERLEQEARELFPKKFDVRSFRCDCGTAKFKETKCKLDPKPAGSTPHNDDFDDFICRTCATEHGFLRRYAQHSLFMIGLSEHGGGPKSVKMIDCSKKNDKDIKEQRIDKKEEEEVDVVATTEATTETTATSTTSTATSATATTTTIETVTVSVNPSESAQQSQTVNQAKRSLETTVEDAEDVDEGDDSKRNKRLKEDADTCKLLQQPRDIYADQEMNLFATEGWRDLLCQCADCMVLYTKENVAFILGEEPIYEDEEDDEVETSIMEGGMKRLSEMNRAEAMDGMLAYNTMRDELRTFFAPFSEEGKVVTAEDIQEFFAAKMAQRAALGGKPNFF